jgi:hypothetical protein
VFVYTADVDRWWLAIRNATTAGRLGCSAKAATARPSASTQSQRVRVICVYTADAEDHGQVDEVLAGLRDLDVNWQLTYKTNEATRAGRYGAGVSAYVSAPGKRTSVAARR